MMPLLASAQSMPLRMEITKIEDNNGDTRLALGFLTDELQPNEQ